MWGNYIVDGVTLMMPWVFVMFTAVFVLLVLLGYSVRYMIRGLTGSFPKKPPETK